MTRSSRLPGWPSGPGQTTADLQPGDTVKFKGGVVYAGSINITASGEQGRPITYDGNASGDWGDGPAIIEESFTTVVVYPGWRAVLDQSGDYVLLHSAS